MNATPPSCDFSDQTIASTRDFRKCVFDEDVSFDRAVFEGPVSFQGAIFKRGASFEGATFEHEPDFSGVLFSGGAWFSKASFKQGADFGDSTFEGTAFGPLAAFDVVGRLRLTGATFTLPVDVVASAEFVDCVGATFKAGGSLKLLWAELDLRRVTIAQPLIVAFAERRAVTKELRELCTGGQEAKTRAIRDGELQRRHVRTARPRLLTVEGTNVENLVLSKVDLRACRFGGAYKLDQVQIEDCKFARTPNWTGRRAVPEECRWRSTRTFLPCDLPWPRRNRWYTEANRPRTGAALPTLDPNQVATIYRALRKGREDAKDEPGAADLYYGEMEMRRHSRAEGGRGVRAAAWWERRTILLYWLFSGYALRPLRAFVALLVLVVVAAVAMHQYGFADLDRPFPPAADPAKGEKARQPEQRLPSAEDVGDALSDSDTIVYSASIALAVVPSPDALLTGTGRAIRALLRILGPIFIGLTLFSIRGRVKR